MLAVSAIIIVVNQPYRGRNDLTTEGRGWEFFSRPISLFE